MNRSCHLSYLYALYSRGELPRKELEGGIVHYLLNNFERYHVFDGDRERWEEFVSWLYFRLVKAINRYKEQGSSFDAYIAGIVYKTAKEYRCREADHSITEYACWTAMAEEMEVRESEPEYDETRPAIVIPRGVKPRHILILLLKSYHLVSDDFLERAAALTGTDAGRIRNMISEIQRRRARHEDERRELREHLHCQYYRCLAYEKRMKAATPGTDYYEKMKDRVMRAMKRYYSMKRRLGKMREGASNRIIAEVTGIPKGTVDSSLYAIKKHLALLEADKKARKRRGAKTDHW